MVSTRFFFSRKKKKIDVLTSNKKVPFLICQHEKRIRIPQKQFSGWENGQQVSANFSLRRRTWIVTHEIIVGGEVIILFSTRKKLDNTNLPK